MYGEKKNGAPVTSMASPPQHSGTGNVYKLKVMLWLNTGTLLLWAGFVALLDYWDFGPNSEHLYGSLVVPMSLLFFQQWQDRKARKTTITVSAEGMLFRYVTRDPSAEDFRWANVKSVEWIRWRESMGKSRKLRINFFCDDTIILNLGTAKRPIYHPQDGAPPLLDAIATAWGKPIPDAGTINMPGDIGLEARQVLWTSVGLLIAAVLLMGTHAESLDDPQLPWIEMGAITLAAALAFWHMRGATVAVKLFVSCIAATCALCFTCMLLPDLAVWTGQPQKVDFTLLTDPNRWNQHWRSAGPATLQLTIPANGYSRYRPGAEYRFSVFTGPFGLHAIAKQEFNCMFVNHDCVLTAAGWVERRNGRLQ